MRYCAEQERDDERYGVVEPMLADHLAVTEPQLANPRDYPNRRVVEPNSLLDRLFAHTPAGFSATFTDDQIAGLNAALLDADTRYHAIDYRTSISFFGIPFYVTFLMGRERRSRERLAMEGQTQIHRVALAHIILTLVIAMSCVAAVACVLYLVKSALGIDLFDGHFALHDMFFE